MEGTVINRMMAPSQIPETECEIVPAAEPVVDQLAAFASDAVDVRIGAVLEIDDVHESVAVDVLPDMSGEIAVQFGLEALHAHMLGYRTDHQSEDGADGQLRYVEIPGLRNRDPDPLIEDLALHVPESAPASGSETVEDLPDRLGILLRVYARQRQVEDLRTARGTQLHLGLLHRRNHQLLQILRTHSMTSERLTPRPYKRIVYQNGRI